MKKISTFTGEQLPEPSARLPYPKQRENPSRCQQCIRNSHGHDQKVNENKLKKIKTACESCGDAFCNEHLIYICKEYYRKVRK